MNPLVPTFSESLMTVAIVFAFVLAVCAVVSVLRSPVVKGGYRILWLLVVLLAPILGPGFWFYVSHYKHRHVSDRHSPGRVGLMGQ